MTTRLAGRRLYISDLLRRQAAFEKGEVPMSALAYRVLAKRLHSALAGEPPAVLRRGFPELPPSLMPLLSEALEARAFAEFGRLQGSAAEDIETRLQGLLRRWRG